MLQLFENFSLWKELWAKQPLQRMAASGCLLFPSNKTERETRNCWMTLDERGQGWLCFDVYLIHVRQTIWAWKKEKFFHIILLAPFKEQGMSSHSGGKMPWKIEFFIKAHRKSWTFWYQNGFCSTKYAEVVKCRRISIMWMLIQRAHYLDF